MLFSISPRGMEERTMDTPVTSVLKFARQLGIETCLEFSPELLVPEQRIRELCSEDKCGNYGKNYMCPPHIGSLEETKAQLQKFQHGVLLQYSRSLDVRNDNEGLKQSKLDFHNKILQLEEFLRNEGINDVWGMIGGSCELCEPCKAEVGEPCPYPNEARTSLTSLAIDILPFLDKFRLDNKFHPDKITWTGCILF